ncbi:MAG TPA: protein-disulfide reductase DsbD domain-containing protein [Gemmatimonadaceae bacterium]|nr:protein-disulfide reductase DsbD domain-containing protein [Gemmatimonadaceae bacterium]
MISALSFAVFLFASATTDSSPVRARVLSGVTTARPGDSVWFGVEIVAQPGWHTYWVNPGDAGAPPSVQWADTPHGTIGPLSWPFPSRIVTPPLAAYGYEGTVTLPFVVSVSSKARYGETLALRGRLAWVACRIECVDGSIDLAADVQIATEHVVASAEAVSRIGEARRRIPSERPGWSATVLEDGSSLSIAIHHAPGDADAVELFPLDRGIIDPAVSMRFERVSGGVIVHASRSPFAPKSISDLRLVVAAHRIDGSIVPVSVTARRFDRGATYALAVLYVAAVLGGVLVNLMPCVFPVLGLKVIGLAELSGRHPARVVRGMLAYTGGVVMSCVAFGASLVAARSGGTDRVWGAQLQSPIVVGTCAIILLAVSLNLIGVVRAPAVLPSWLVHLASHQWHEGFGWFASGAFTIVLAAPCTAPFLGAAAAGSLALPRWQSLGFWAAFGAGVAMPTIVLAARPGLLRHLPRPGRWMDVFRFVSAIPAAAGAVWLAFVLRAQLAPAARVDPGWQSFDAARLTMLRSAGFGVLVDFTADWCLTCKVNEHRALVGAGIDSMFDRARVVPMRADLTRHDPEVARALSAIGRASVPAYAVYAPGSASPELLPLILDRATVIAALRRVEEARRSSSTLAPGVHE